MRRPLDFRVRVLLSRRGGSPIWGSAYAGPLFVNLHSMRMEAMSGLMEC